MLCSPECRDIFIYQCRNVLSSYGERPGVSKKYLRSSPVRGINNAVNSWHGTERSEGLQLADDGSGRDRYGQDRQERCLCEDLQTFFKVKRFCIWPACQIDLETIKFDKIISLR